MRFLLWIDAWLLAVGKAVTGDSLPFFMARLCVGLSGCAFRGDVTIVVTILYDVKGGSFGEICSKRMGVFVLDCV